MSQNNSSVALGNLIGSSISNILASFSLGLLFIESVTFDHSSKIYATVLLVVTTIFLILLFTLDTMMKWIAGSILVISFIVYVASVASLIYQGTLTLPEDDLSGSESESESETDEAEEGNDTSDEEESLVQEKPSNGSSLALKESTHSRKLILSSKASKKCHIRKLPNRRPKPLWRHLLQLLMGLGSLLVSGYVIAYSANSLGMELGLSGTVVGTTILSLWRRHCPKSSWLSSVGCAASRASW